MNKKVSLGAAITFMVVVAGITFCITMMVALNHFNTKVYNVKSREEMYKKIADVDRETRQNFSGVIDEEVLLDSLSAGYIKGIGDKYSYYLTKNQYEQRLRDLSGKYVGIGITSAKDESGYLKVKKVLKDSAADKSGIQVGDHIVSIANTDLKAVSNENSQRLLKGEVGTKVNVVYRRNGVDETIEIIRTDISIPSVELSMNDTNAIIKISTFDDLTYTQFNTAIDKAVKQNATAIIFDLRNCTGDSLNSAKAMLNVLLPSGEMGKIIDNHGKETPVGSSDKFEINLPMATIINNKTMGSAEFFAATLRDFKKSNSIGALSYGKGLMQTLFKLTDGSAVNITTSQIFPPSNEPIEGVGIKPDYEVKLSTEQEQRFDELTPEEDSQLQKAIEVVNSKKPKKQ